jgi:hypothetical protein
MQARRDPLTAMKEMGRPSTAIRPLAEQMTGTLKSDGVNIVVWAKNSLEHI